MEIVREWSVPHWNLAFCLDLGGLDGTESKRNLFCSMTSDLPTFKNLFPLGDFFPPCRCMIVARLFFSAIDDRVPNGADSSRRSKYPRNETTVNS